MPDTAPDHEEDTIDYTPFLSGVEYGIVLDDLGSTDIYATLEEARAAQKTAQKLYGAKAPLVKITTEPVE